MTRRYTDTLLLLLLFFFKVVKAFLFTFDHRMLLPWEFQGSSGHTVLGDQ